MCRAPAPCGAPVPAVGPTALLALAQSLDVSLPGIRGLAQAGLDPAIADNDLVGVVAAVGAHRVVACALTRAALGLGIRLAFAILDRRGAHLGMGGARRC